MTLNPAASITTVTPLMMIIMLLLMVKETGGTSVMTVGAVTL